MINLFSALLPILASLSDFFNKKVELGSMTFKIWQFIVIGIAAVVLIILVIALAIENSKLRKLKAEKENLIESDETSVAAEVAADSCESSAEEKSEEPAPVLNAQNESVLDKEQDVKEQVEDTQIAREEPIQEEEVSVEEPIEEEPVEEQSDEEAPIREESASEESNNEPIEDNTILQNTQEENEQMKAEEKENVVNEPIENNVPQEEAEKGAIGKYTIQLSLQGYCFTLSANNGQILYESFGYTSVEGAAIGIDTFKKTVAAGKFHVSGDKYGRYRFILNKRYQGPNYPSKIACEKAIKSVQRFANNSKIVIVDPTEEELQQYNEVVQESKKDKDVDWEALNQEYALLPRLGSFEISVNEDGAYQFCLIANNKQILYTSVLYANLITVKKGIENFRKAVCLGTFFVEMDKYKRYRFILRVSNTVTYVGESYTTKASALSSIESVKNFVKTARIVLVKNGEDGEEEV